MSGTKLLAATVPTTCRVSRILKLFQCIWHSAANMLSLCLFFCYRFRGYMYHVVGRHQNRHGSTRMALSPLVHSPNEKSLNGCFHFLLGLLWLGWTWWCRIGTSTSHNVVVRMSWFHGVGLLSHVDLNIGCRVSNGPHALILNLALLSQTRDAIIESHAISWALLRHCSVDACLYCLFVWLEF